MCQNCHAVGTAVLKKLLFDFYRFLLEMTRVRVIEKLSFQKCISALNTPGF